MDTAARRALIDSWLQAALAAVRPDALTERALGSRAGPATLIAIGKAAPGMTRGAAKALGVVNGICVAANPDQVPAGVELVVGDHPVPGDASFHAGARVLEVVAEARHPIIALISGGGSALCEHPAEGVTRSFIGEVNSKLLDAGTSIADLNLVRRHLSAIKGGGLLSAASQPIETLVISDVCGGEPALVASGPTSPMPVDAHRVISILTSHDIDVPAAVLDAIERAESAKPSRPLRVIADGRTAMEAVAANARAEGVVVSTSTGWLRGDVDTAVATLFEDAQEGLTVATGEVDVEVTGSGSGGRNTHAALVAARHLRGSRGIFAAFATDGIDGRSHSAGAIVDGQTIERGGNPDLSLAESDSGGYLQRAGDLVVTGPTGTNVGDLWMLWL